MNTSLFLSPFVVLEAVLHYCRLNKFLLFHFIITLAILVVVLRIFIPFIRVESNCRFAIVYTGWLEYRYTKLYNGIGNGINSRDISVQIPYVVQQSPRTIRVLLALDSRHGYCA